MNDSQLVAAHLAGVPGAFSELYGRYRDRLVQFIWRKTGDRDRAEDLVQEGFIRVTRHLHRFVQSEKFSTWVYRRCADLAQ
jgi:RNA polymerase sigma-70 factor (ECF subfamily)